MSGWDGFEEFVAVATAGSFVGGAATLGQSTSHVSRAIARLEKRIESPLFYRTTRKVTLTDAGRVLVDQCRRIILERDEALAMISGDSEPQGDLRVTCSTTLGERFVAPIIRRYIQANPRVTVTLDLTNRVVDLVSEGYDLAIRTGHLPDSRLIATRIASRRLYLCASPDYIARKGRPQEIKDLDRHQCLVGTATAWHFDVDGEDFIYRPKGRMRCNSGAVMVEAAVEGMGICQLPEFYVLAEIASGRLVTLLDHRQAEDEPVWAVCPERRHLLPKVRRLSDMLRSELGPSLNGRPPKQPYRNSKLQKAALGHG